jgi:hypothetical protein
MRGWLDKLGIEEIVAKNHLSRQKDFTVSIAFPLPKATDNLTLKVREEQTTIRFFKRVHTHTHHSDVKGGRNARKSPVPPLEGW